MCVYCFRGLADTDADGRMDINEFSIACKLISMKLRGFEIPKTLPPCMQLLAQGQGNGISIALFILNSVFFN